MTALLSITALLVVAGLQAKLPALGWLGGARLELLPALVTFGALTFGRWTGLLFAVAAGCAQDALSAAPFGWTSLAYGLAALLLILTNQVFDRDLPPLQMAGGAVASLLAGLAGALLAGWPRGAAFKLLLLAVLSGILTPFIFAGLDALRRRSRPRWT